jgi:ribosomal protein S18 acetylase RimI-like enzyme
MTTTSRMEATDIKKVTVNELYQLQKISRQTFFETYSAVNTEENMKMYLEERFSIEKLTDELHNPESEFYFAEFNNKVIGYLKLNFGQAQTEVKNTKALEIERIYVLKEFQGKKVGQVLYEKAMQIAIQKNAPYVWLGVWEENPKAINFYKKHGFIEFDKHLFMLGNDQQTDIMMIKQVMANNVTDY